MPSLLLHSPILCGTNCFEIEACHCSFLDVLIVVLLRVRHAAYLLTKTNTEATVVMAR